MSKTQTKAPVSKQNDGGATLRQSPMMAHLLDALDAGTDIGHYGRLTFVMVARHFLSEDELVAKLRGQPEMDEKAARVLVLQVQERDYNPPQRRKILEWQAEQAFPICPTPDDPRGCNVYTDLTFPDHIYEQVEEYYEEKAEARGDRAE
jgi:DNA primase large subunit